MIELPKRVSSDLSKKGFEQLKSAAVPAGIMYIYLCIFIQHALVSSVVHCTVAIEIFWSPENHQVRNAGLYTFPICDVFNFLKLYDEI